MPDLPKLSIIIIFQNQRDVVESTIDALYELPLQSFELILIDDGSTDDTGDIIHSLIEYYRHVDTYFFDRSEQFGKGRSLNEALFTVSGDFLWIVDALDEVSESELTNVLENLKSSEKLVSVNSGFLPSLNEETWRKLIEEKKFPSNQSFIWNWKKIP
ncbi:MAG TPA: glycosyltransferase, partial [Balneolales bacterium]|nr:glycosyltransferase [Balneolales bacterium]